MGLTIHYELSLPGSTSDADALGLLRRLHATALELNVETVPPIFTFTAGELLQPDDDWPRQDITWWLHIMAGNVRELRDGRDAAIDDPARVGAMAFLMCPGEGSEPAPFGLVRPFLSQPPVLEVEDVEDCEDVEDPEDSEDCEDVDDAKPTDKWDRWFWWGCCKTQYATAVSDEHFVHCHLAIVKLLEEAQRIGFGVTVHDEGAYWESRSVDRLIAEAHRMNQILARFAGTLHDASIPVQAEIFKHPDFERLETEPLRDPAEK